MADNTATLYVQISPNASKNSLEGFRGDILRIKIAAPPVEGKANKELVAYLSNVLDVSKSSVRIVKGHTLRNKVIAIDGLTPAGMMTKILNLLPAANKPDHH